MFFNFSRVTRLDPQDLTRKFFDAIFVNFLDLRRFFQSLEKERREAERREQEALRNRNKHRVTEARAPQPVKPKVRI